jgi:hypothetical protein
MSKKTLEERFWLKVNIIDLSSCWEWTGNKNRDGYGRIPYHNKSMRAHRMAWIFAHGDIPKGMFVCHHCDNPTYDAGIVMDIFAGTCTTAVAAKQLNRHYLMLELKPEYIKMGEERIAKEGAPKPKRKTKTDKQAEYEQWLEKRQMELF